MSSFPKEADRPRFEPATFWIASERSTVTPHRPQAGVITISYVLPVLKKTSCFHKMGHIVRHVYSGAARA